MGMKMRLGFFISGGTGTGKEGLMFNDKGLGGIVVGSCLAFLMSCERAQETTPPSPPAAAAPPRTACRNECSSGAKKLLEECREKMTAAGTLDRLAECAIQADEHTKQCQAECDKKFVTQQ
jgi:hypothetical protein